MVIWHYNLRIVQKPFTGQDWHLSATLALQDGQCENSLDAIATKPPPPGWGVPLPPPQKQLSGGRAAALCQGLTPGVAARFEFLSWKLISYKNQPGCKRDATWMLSPPFFFLSFFFFFPFPGCIWVFLVLGIQGFSAFWNRCHFRPGRKGVIGHPAKSCFSHLLSSFQRNAALSPGWRWDGARICSFYICKNKQ